MSKFLKVKDHPDLIRDTNSSAILNTNRKQLDKYREERELRLKMHDSIREINEIKSEMSEIKQLLKNLIAGQKQ